MGPIQKTKLAKTFINEPRLTYWMAKNGILIVGERRSNLAIEKGWTWTNGEHLAAAQLFPALRKAGVAPEECEFTNLFEHGGVSSVLWAERRGLKIVALGNDVSKELEKRGVDHLKLVHPAARGSIRKKERYQVHVAEKIKELFEPQVVTE